MLSLSKHEMPSAEVQDFAQAARAAVAHAAYQIANAPLRLYPAPHIYVSSIFPPDFYELLLQHFPSPLDFKQMRASAHGNMGIHESRHYLSHADGDYAKLPASQAGFWHALLHALNAPVLHAAITSRFFPYFDVPRAAALGSHRDLLMISDRSGYAISPHTDTPQKLCSLLFYCPPNADHPELGTSFYTPRGAEPRAARWYDGWFYRGEAAHLPFDGFEKIATMPYVPNALFGFVRTRHSFHAVEPGGAEVTRQLLIYENFSMRDSRRLAAQRAGGA